ncbi:MAG: phosphoglycerate mutase family protein [Pseudomonadota bacterium]
MKSIIAFFLFVLAFTSVDAGTVFLVRHAEKADKPKEDPALSEAGRERAKHLAAMLDSVPVVALYSSDYRRTRSTLAPLAQAKTLDVVIYDASDSEALAKMVMEKHSDDTVVIAGHSNTVPELVEALGGTATPLEDKDYDNLFVLTRDSDGNVSTLRLHYGERTNK